MKILYFLFSSLYTSFLISSLVSFSPGDDYQKRMMMMLMTRLWILWVQVLMHVIHRACFLHHHFSYHVNLRLRRCLRRWTASKWVTYAFSSLPFPGNLNTGNIVLHKQRRSRSVFVSCRTKKWRGFDSFCQPRASRHGFEKTQASHWTEIHWSVSSEWGGLCQCCWR